MSLRDRVRQTAFPSGATHAWVALLAAADHVATRGELVFARHGITGDQYNVLRILRGAHPAGYARGDVAARLVRRAPDVTRLLDRLARRRLVERVRSPDDGRRSIARITPAGLRLLHDIEPDLDQAVREVMAPLSPPQLAHLAQLCDALLP